MRTRKSTAFWAAFWALLAIYFVTLKVAPTVLESIGTVIVAAIAAAGGIYQVTNVADNAAKGKFYRPELDRKEQ